MTVVTIPSRSCIRKPACRPHAPLDLPPKRRINLPGRSRARRPEGSASLVILSDLAPIRHFGRGEAVRKIAPGYSRSFGMQDLRLSTMEKNAAAEDRSLMAAMNSAVVPACAPTAGVGSSGTTDGIGRLSTFSKAARFPGDSRKQRNRSRYAAIGSFSAGGSVAASARSSARQNCGTRKSDGKNVQFAYARRHQKFGQFALSGYELLGGAVLAALERKT